MKNEVQSFYGNRLRLRACGICIRGNSILMANHQGISSGNFWAPPGGGIQFGEQATECLHREFEEETGMSIEIKGFLFACEFIDSPFHAVELFFEISSATNTLKVGIDPETGSPPIISEVKFLTWNEIEALHATELHGIFNYLSHPSEIIAQRGFFKV